MFRGRRELDRFESELKEYFGVKHCFLVSSGKAAFVLILLALKELFPDRDEVLIPALNCYSVPSAIRRAGLRTKLCDLGPDGLDFDFKKLTDTFREDALPNALENDPDGSGGAPITDVSVEGNYSGVSPEKLLAIVPTHLFGYPANVSGLRKLIRDPDITIVEDAAQAMGESVNERKLGTFGDVGFFSLARGKAFTVVEGGVIVTNREDVAEVLNSIFGRLPCYGLLQKLKLVLQAVALMMLVHPRLFWIPRSIPFLKLGETLFETDFPVRKMSSFQAGLSRNWREKLANLRKCRQRKTDRWVAAITASESDALSCFKSESLGPLRFPLRVSNEKKRSSMLNESAQEGLGIMPVYPTSIDFIPQLRGEVSKGAYPVAESFARQLVTLPTHEYVADGDVTRISRLISRALK